ncbi:MAG: thioredoxin family protein [Lachnospiraceae bacterium]|nr:thioredoxin family protein [Lachnospiraceae bacterium]
MKKMMMFYMPGCPYCRQGMLALEELKKEIPAFEKVEIEFVDETAAPEIADRYDYFHVPTVFVDGEKVYEAHPGESYEECRAMMRKALEAAL